jgi:hypothetical protein
MSKLSELVRSAIADAETKIASARDAAPEVPESNTKVASVSAPVAVPAEKRAGVVKTAARALEMANALDNLGMLMPKIAEGNTNRSGGSVGPQDLNGPAISASVQMGATRDTATKARILSHEEASSGGGPSSGMHVDTNREMNASSSSVKGAALADWLPGADTASLDPEVQQQIAHRSALVSGANGAVAGGLGGVGLGRMAGGGRGAVIGGLAGTAVGALGGYGARRANAGLRHAIDNRRVDTAGRGTRDGRLVPEDNRLEHHINRAVLGDVYAQPISKEAAEQILLAKVAQAEALVAAGRAHEAEALALQAKQEYDKVASRFGNAAKTIRSKAKDIAKGVAEAAEPKIEAAAQAIGSKARDVAHGGKGVKGMTQPSALRRGARKVTDTARRIGRDHLGGTDINSDTGRGLMAMGGAGAAAVGTAGAGAAGVKAFRNRSKSGPGDAEKKAYEEEDGATHTPKSNPRTLETFISGMSGAPGGVARDNAGMISMTRRDGKSRERSEIAKHLAEPAFSASSDHGIQDNVLTTHGAKIASIRQKIAHRAFQKRANEAGPEASGVMADRAQYLPAASGLLTAGWPVGGAYVGMRRGEGSGREAEGALRGAAGHFLGGTGGGVVGGLAGGVAGALGGTALGALGGRPGLGAQIGGMLGGAGGATVGNVLGGAHGINYATRSLLPQEGEAPAQKQANDGMAWHERHRGTMGGVGGALLGGAAGAALGDRLGGTPGMIAGGTLGTAAGALGGGAAAFRSLPPQHRATHLQKMLADPSLEPEDRQVIEGALADTQAGKNVNFAL